jgi:hypothetical protein
LPANAGYSAATLVRAVLLVSALVASGPLAMGAERTR